MESRKSDRSSGDYGKILHFKLASLSKILHFKLASLSKILHFKLAFYQCCGSGMFIPDPGSDFFHPGSDFFSSRIRLFSIPDPGSDFFLPGSRIRIKEFKYWSWLFTHPGSRGQKRHRIPDPRIRNTAFTPQIQDIPSLSRFYPRSTPCGLPAAPSPSSLSP